MSQAVVKQHMSLLLSPKATIAELLPGFFEYLMVERKCAKDTIKTYKKCMAAALSVLGDLDPKEVQLSHFISLRARLSERGAGEAHIAMVTSVLKTFLRYCRDVLRTPILDLTGVKAKHPRRREVRYLTEEELNQFREAIPLCRGSHESPRLSGYRFRAIVEALVATGMRLPELVSLNRDALDLNSGRLRISGKNGNRTVVCANPALEWISQYLRLRPDTGEPLFANVNGSRLSVKQLEMSFLDSAGRAGLDHRVNARVLRDTAASRLLRSGYSLERVNDILGHRTIETTLRRYLSFVPKTENKLAP